MGSGWQPPKRTKWKSKDNNKKTTLWCLYGAQISVGPEKAEKKREERKEKEIETTTTNGGQDSAKKFCKEKLPFSC